MVALDDDDPLWEQHSGGEGHRGAEWRKEDGALAAAFYAALPEHTRFVFDLLMDHPGERLTSDWIAEQLTRRRAGGSPTAVGFDQYEPDCPADREIGPADAVLLVARQR